MEDILDSCPPGINKNLKDKEKMLDSRSESGMTRRWMGMTKNGKCYIICLLLLDIIIIIM
jgi:hypothetical protein